MASLIAHKFSVVTTLKRSIAPIERNLIHYGLAARCARVRAANVPVLALEEPGSKARRSIEAEIARALAQDGAEAIVLGCAGMTDLARDLERKAGVPVLDGVACATAEWLALDEGVRVRRAKDYHRRAGVSLPNEEMHAAFHVVIETQIARGDELPVRRAMDRLIAEGLDRHEAIHALASVLTDHMSHAFPLEAYNAAIERLTAGGWRRYWEDAEG